MPLTNLSMERALASHCQLAREAGRQKEKLIAYEVNDLGEIWQHQFRDGFCHSRVSYPGI